MVQAQAPLGKGAHATVSYQNTERQFLHSNSCFQKKTPLSYLLMLKIMQHTLCFFLMAVGVNLLHSDGGKRVYINKSTQTLTAYEGDEVVLTSRVSTGKSRSPTPNGTFQVGVKDRMHRSRLYNNAPMPYSVQFNNNYFIHGFSSVPNYPASHGCVRMPIGDAQELFEWITPGTPVTVGGGHATKSKAKSSAQKRTGNSENGDRVVKKERLVKKAKAPTSSQDTSTLVEEDSLAEPESLE